MNEHLYVGERCIYCDVNVYDNDIYGPFDCMWDREPMTYTTETGHEPTTNVEGDWLEGGLYYGRATMDW